MDEADVVSIQQSVQLIDQQMRSAAAAVPHQYCNDT